MKAIKISLPAIAALAITAIPGRIAAQASYENDSIGVPQRAIILTGNPGENNEHIAVLYSREGMSFDDPSAPRFLFLDREGKVALGIGGYVKGVASYDFDGAIDDNGFVTNAIPVPADPALRNRFGADASHSTIFLKLVTKNSKLGRIIVYVQTNFTGDDGGYGLKLKQAYVSVGHLTAGLARSTFADGESQAPTVDTQGPSGQIDAKNMLFQYKTSSWHGVSAAISAEFPKADYTITGGDAEKISQRFPDIPLYVQYSWKSGNHIRLSGILRELSYRDLIAGKNRFETGWGAHFSTIADIVGGLKFFGHVAYGKGIAHYVNDLGDIGYDLIPSDTPGKMKAPGVLAWTGGLQYNFTKDFFMSANYSYSRVYQNELIGVRAYKYAQYVAVNGFYNIIPDLMIGAEYVYGRRNDVDRFHGNANRFEAMLQYSF